MTNIRIATVAIVSGVVAVAGCGGVSRSEHRTAQTGTPNEATTASSETASTPVVAATGRPLLRSVWIAEGDAICARLHAQIASMPVRSTNISDFARVLPLAAADEQEARIQLSELVPPVSHAHDWQRFLTETGEWAANSRKLGESASAGKFSLTLPVAVATREAHRKLARIARRDGFKNCSLI